MKRQSTRFISSCYVFRRAARGNRGARIASSSSLHQQTLNTLHYLHKFFLISTFFFTLHYQHTHILCLNYHHGKTQYFILCSILLEQTHQARTLFVHLHVKCVAALFSFFHYISIYSPQQHLPLSFSLYFSVVDSFPV